MAVNAYNTAIAFRFEDHFKPRRGLAEGDTPTMLRVCENGVHICYQTPTWSQSTCLLGELSTATKSQEKEAQSRYRL